MFFTTATALFVVPPLFCGNKNSPFPVTRAARTLRHVEGLVARSVAGSCHLPVRVCWLLDFHALLVLVFFGAHRHELGCGPCPKSRKLVHNAAEYRQLVMLQSAASSCQMVIVRTQDCAFIGHYFKEMLACRHARYACAPPPFSTPSINGRAY